MQQPDNSQGHGSIHRQARELISAPSPATKARLLSFNRTQSRVVTGLFTGRNKLRRHTQGMRLRNNPRCRLSGTEEKSVHILCECEALASRRQTYLGSFFFDPENIMNLSTGTIWNSGKGKGFLETSVRLWGTKGMF